MINFLIASSSWPDEWKCSNLTPVLKKDEETRKENYRPVSVLTALQKIYEKVMYDQLYNTFCLATCHKTSLDFLRLKNHSCRTALLKMTEDWRRSLDNREPWQCLLIYQRLLTQERIKGTEKASAIHTLFHRYSSRVILRIGIKLPRALRGCFVEVSHD